MFFLAGFTFLPLHAALNFSSLDLPVPWSPRRHGHLSLDPSGALVFYGGRPIYPPYYSWARTDPPISGDFAQAWRYHSVNTSWAPTPVAACLELWVSCPGQPPWSRGLLLQPSLVSPSTESPTWQAWQALIARPLDREERHTCLSQGRGLYSLQPCTPNSPTRPAGLLVPPLSPGSRWDHAAQHPQWFLPGGVPRFGALTAIHYHNPYLEGNDVYYVLGGTYPVPDGEDHEFRDLWASRDGGASWVKILFRHPWPTYYDPLGQLSFGISARGVMIVTVATPPEQVWVSLDGGETWGWCNPETPIDLQGGGIIGFDVHGYLHMIVGHQSSTEPGVVIRSDWSFDNVTRVRQECGHPWIGGRGPGLVSWPSRELEWPSHPQIGIQIAAGSGVRELCDGGWSVTSPDNSDPNPRSGWWPRD